MAQTVMDFLEAFPGLSIPAQTAAHFSGTKVEKISINQARDQLHVHVRADALLPKDAVYAVEDAIAEQIFSPVEMKVTIIERFSLPIATTAELFYRNYRPAMLLELKKTSPLLHQAFLHTKIRFPDAHTIYAMIPRSLISEERLGEITDYLKEVFCYRAGFSAMEVYAELAETETASDGAGNEEIMQRVREIVKRSEVAKAEEKEEVKKLSAIPGTNARQPKSRFMPDKEQIFGRRPITEEAAPIETLGEDPHEVVIAGEVFSVEERKTQSGKVVFLIALTDQTDSIRIKLWAESAEVETYRAEFQQGNAYLVKGMMDYDAYERETMVRTVYAIKKLPPLRTPREDHAATKRVELHCHTKMSEMDAVSDVKDIIGQAYAFGMKSIAITDHGVVQAFPEALKAFGSTIPKDADMKIIYGMEAYLVDDGEMLVQNADETPVDAPVCVVAATLADSGDVTPAVLSLAACKIVNAEITDRFISLVRPSKILPDELYRAHGFEPLEFQSAPTIEEAVKELLSFAGDATIVAEDVHALSLALRAVPTEDPWQGRRTLDLMGLLRFLKPRHMKADFVKTAKALKLKISEVPGAGELAGCMAKLMPQLFAELKAQGIESLQALQEKSTLSVERIKHLPYYHAILLAQNERGRQNLYRLVSESHLRYFHRRPRIPKSLLSRYREGLILGSACSAGELFRAILRGEKEERIRDIIDYYDYLEIQPIGNNAYMVREQKNGIHTEDDLRAINRRIFEYGKRYGKMVCATCDVHFLNPEDAIYRRILQAGQGYPDEAQAPLYLHTTDEMLKEFAYLGPDQAYEAVVTNPNRVADLIERVSPIYSEKCPPSIPHAAEDLREMCLRRAAELYGDPLPPVVEKRLHRELSSIIDNGYAVMYIIAKRLVEKSNEAGYVVGSRGSVGSSIVATMAEITEVNPLPPHYVCPSCKYSDFDSPEVKAYAGRCGIDMPDKVCPVCGTPLKKDGFDIPFETFLGFDGDKEPDIDLNFSGDVQETAQKYTEELFGAGQTFKAGTVTGLADKNAFGFVANYFKDKGISKRKCELDRLTRHLMGVRKSTGQHPGGIVVLPRGMDINTFTPVQYPANNSEKGFITTHFDYHSIEDNLLKLDILGHDNPTIIHFLKEVTGTDPMDAPLNDPAALSLFSSTEALGIDPEDIDGCEMGVLGIPEFGTSFVIGMLKDTKPKTFAELVRISGLSHGTNVWLDNAQYYIRNGDATLSTAICTRDDIMLYLIEQGIEPLMAFKIMEFVRKNKDSRPLPEEMVEAMRENHVPEWYIDSCRKIQYMFPKAHAAAYVMDAVRIAYYKVHDPLAYYAAMCSVRVPTFEYESMAQGKGPLEMKAAELRKKIADGTNTPQEEKMLKDMRIVREMYARGIEMHPLDLYKAHATKFTILDGKLMPALTSIDGLGETAAFAIADAAKDGPFLSVEDFRNRTHTPTDIIQTMKRYGLFGEMPQSNQMSLFD